MTATLEVTDLWATDLGYRIDSAELLRGVDLHITSGLVTGVLGPNGSGKSTLLRLVVGALPPSAGHLHLGDHDLGRVGRRERARTVALVEQDVRAEVSLTVRDVVGLGRTPYHGPFSADSAEDDEVVERSMLRAGVAGLAGRGVATLSGGERQRVHLARALAQTPRVLLLDEPTNHLDVAAQLEMLTLVRDAADAGTGVLMALHDLSHAARVCDSVVVLHHGEVAAAGDPREVLTPELVADVYGVRAEWVHGATGSALVYSALR